MKNPALLLTGILIWLFISTCTIQKRRVNKGYFVQWNWDKKMAAPFPTEKNHDLPDEATLETYELLVSLQPDEAAAIEVEPLPAYQGKSHSIETHTEGKIISQAVNTEPVLKKEPPQEKRRKFEKMKPAADVELIINVVLLVAFLVLTVVFTILAIHVAAGTMLYVWGGLALLCLVLFVTQVIDVIMW